MSKRENLINVGMKLFVSQGFENTPTAQISKEAGVATGTLFHYFKTKEELINEIYKHVKNSMRETLFESFDTGNLVKDQLNEFWLNFLKWGFENKDANLFLRRFYGSTHITSLTVDEIRLTFETAFNLFKLAQKEKLVKNISFNLIENLTFSIAQSFLTEFYLVGKLEKNLLNMSFEVYWDAIKLEEI